MKVQVSIKSKLGMILSLIVITISMLFFLLTFALCIYFFAASWEEGKYDESWEEGKVSYDYQYYQYNTLTKKSTTGFLSFTEQLDDDSPERFTRIENNHYLISNFGSLRFRCTGTCVCLEEGSTSRRAASSVVSFSRTLLYLVVAASSLFAIEKAKEYFSEECVEELSRSCTLPLSTIRSEDVTCQKVYDDDTTTDSEEEENTISVEQEEEPVVYQCKGNCLTRKLKHNYYSNKKLDSVEHSKDSTHCEQLEYEGKSLIRDRDMHEYLMDKIAIAFFINEQLNSFCLNNSKYRIWEADEDDLTRGKWRDTFLCSGEDDDYYAENETKNPSVKCTRVS